MRLVKGHSPVSRAGRTSSFHCLLLAIAAAVVGPINIHSSININKY